MTERALATRKFRHAAGQAGEALAMRSPMPCRHCDLPCGLPALPFGEGRCVDSVPGKPQVGNGDLAAHEMEFDEFPHSTHARIHADGADKVQRKDKLLMCYQMPELRKLRLS